MQKDIVTTGKEVTFAADDIIVSKTNLKGHITYANRTFLEISGFTENEVLGKPHSMIRHPDMPRCIFKMLWDNISTGKEIFAYVMNLCKNGDHYWVYAHVTPSFDNSGRIIGYHSNRRVPQSEIIKDIIIPLYKNLKAAEELSDRKAGLEASISMINKFLKEQNIEYDEYIMTAGQQKRRGYR